MCFLIIQVFVTNIKGIFMKTRLLRSNSIGFAGTIRNTYDHAPKLIPYVLQVAKDAQNWGFAEWLQAHNTHIFITKDNRKIILREIHMDKSYVGISIEISKNIRCAAGDGLLIANILDGVDSPEYFSQLMKSLAATPIQSTPAEKVDNEEIDLQEP
jgi:hypothetical protein